jgi:hypothetical protein
MQMRAPTTMVPCVFPDRVLRQVKFRSARAVSIDTGKNLGDGVLGALVTHGHGDVQGANQITFAVNRRCRRNLMRQLQLEFRHRPASSADRPITRLLVRAQSGAEAGARDAAAAGPLCLGTACAAKPTHRLGQPIKLNAPQHPLLRDAPSALVLACALVKTHQFKRVCYTGLSTVQSGRSTTLSQQIISTATPVDAVSGNKAEHWPPNCWVVCPHEWPRRTRDPATRCRSC